MAKKEEKKDIGITVKKSDNSSEWYTQVIQKAEMADYTEVSGCMVLRPRSYAIWEKVQEYFNKELKKRGIKNAYFPLLIPEKFFKKESEHVEGFTPEVAWVTHSGDTKLAEKLAVRPTSETIMYDSYSKWIRSYRDLPLRINQWANVVRWEFKNPVPFLRTREFLWQEGHTVFATKKEAEAEVLDIIELYRQVFEDCYAVPMITGKKSEKEKFAGAVYTTSIETFLPVGKAIQGGTSHFLGQNFSKVFNIQFLDKNEKTQYGWQNSWGITTRGIGVMIFFHGDDKGLVIPPAVAPTHAVIVPIYMKDKEKVLKAANKIKASIKGYDIILDDRDEYTPGYKYGDWEMKGVPVRIEIGPKDIEKKQVVMVRRDTGEKAFVPVKDINTKLKSLLKDIQKNLLETAKKSLKNNIVQVKDWKEFLKAIKDKKMVKAAWCEETECEEWIQDKSGGAKSINIPFDQPKKIPEKCCRCGKKAKSVALFAKSY
ncbi:proline--tRNA ligase [Candidatus Woesearchaeota archaeon]|nr:proline--tRNA ligase [Candidatus Woesearchaeota archaeon]